MMVSLDYSPGTKRFTEVYGTEVNDKNSSQLLPSSQLLQSYYSGLSQANFHMMRHSTAMPSKKHILQHVTAATTPGSEQCCIK